ncbi:MAG: FecR family protein [Brevinematales bacterium]|nr:FecR family protein [Brevinematales bacterium]
MRKFFIVFSMILLSVGLLFGQVDKFPYVEVVIGDVQYAVFRDQTKQGTVYKNLDSGITIPLYSIIRTGPDGYTEIKLAPNKTIKIFGSSTVLLSRFQTDNAVELGTGKVRAIFKRILQTDEFKIMTDTGVAAVRGTDFGVIYSRGQGNMSLMEVFVKEGIVNLSTTTGISVDVREGFSSTINNYLGNIEISDPRPIQLSDFDKYFSEPQPIQQVQQPTQQLPQPSPQQNNQVPTQPSQQPQPPSTQPSQTDVLPTFSFGWEVSSQNIDGNVWNKIVLSPVFKVGKFGIGLYLVSYWDGKNNIYDTTKWYNSKEYDFGFQSNSFVVTDFLDDISKKILFLSYGSKGENVFVRLGSIPDITLGHGFLMDRYSNMLGFPAIRKIGFQFDVDFGIWGIETAIADISRSRLFGGRIFLRPLYGTPFIGNLGFGISGVVDLEPLSIGGQTFEGNPSVFMLGADIDFPVVDLGVFSLILYADIGKTGIYINGLGENSYMAYLASIYGYNQGFNLLKGEGFATGLKGSIISMVPYRIEYRRINNQFIPSYFDTLYDAQKELKLSLLLSGTLSTFNGILGSTGVYVTNIAEATILYEQLWPEDDFSIVSINKLVGRFKISKELVKMISGIPSYATITYQRNFIPSAQVFFEDVLRDSTVVLELAYSIDPNTDISISYRRFYLSLIEYQESVSIQVKSSIFGELGM